MKNTRIKVIYLPLFLSGLEILAYPCNQFGSQELGTNEEIVEFACTTFKAEYHIFDKVYTNLEGNGSHVTSAAWAMLALFDAGQIFSADINRDEPADVKLYENTDHQQLVNQVSARKQSQNELESSEA
ncbi:hypothetical protein ACET3Z_027909 [Daucus carota]